MPHTTVKPDKADKEKDAEGSEDEDNKKTEKPTVDQTNIGDESAFFMVELKNPQPAGLRLSRKNICFVEIRP